jgi:hypothetical protein
MSIGKKLGISGFGDRFRRRAIPWMVDKLLELDSVKLAPRLKHTGADRILVDNTIRSHAVTHETIRLGQRILEWGDIDVPVSKIARIPVHSSNVNGIEFESILYLPSIAALGRHLAVTLFDSYELRDERFRQPPGRFQGYGLDDHWLLSGVPFSVIDDKRKKYSRIIINVHGSDMDLANDQRTRLENNGEPLYRDLVRILGKKNSQDAYHIFTAEINNIFCFLTMDFNLLNIIKSQSNNEIIANLRTRVLSPQQFGVEFGLRKISPRLLSYYGLRTSVVNDLHMPNSKRRPRRRVGK